MDREQPSLGAGLTVTGQWDVENNLLELCGSTSETVERFAGMEMNEDSATFLSHRAVPILHSAKLSTIPAQQQHPLRFGEIDEEIRQAIRLKLSQKRIGGWRRLDTVVVRGSKVGGAGSGAAARMFVRQQNCWS
jgi:hypothetical protein